MEAIWNGVCMQQMELYNAKKGDQRVIQQTLGSILSSDTSMFSGYLIWYPAKAPEASLTNRIVERCTKKWLTLWNLLEIFPLPISK